MRPAIVTADEIANATQGLDPELESLDSMLEARGAAGIDAISWSANHYIDPIEHCARIERRHARPLASLFGCEYL